MKMASCSSNDSSHSTSSTSSPNSTTLRRLSGSSTADRGRGHLNVGRLLCRGSIKVGLVWLEAARFLNVALQYGIALIFRFITRVEHSAQPVTLALLLLRGRRLGTGRYVAAIKTSIKSSRPITKHNQLYFCRIRR